METQESGHSQSPETSAKLPTGFEMNWKGYVCFRHKVGLVETSKPQLADMELYSVIFGLLAFDLHLIHCFLLCSHSFFLGDRNVYSVLFYTGHN